MSWPTANNWISKMNESGYLGYNEWRLPALSTIEGSWWNLDPYTNNATSDQGYAKTTTDGNDGGWRYGSGTGMPVSELGHMYYVSLGNKGRYIPDDDNPQSRNIQDGWGLVRTGPFRNILPHVYWTGARIDNETAFYLHFSDGEQNFVLTDGSSGYAWAVHDGDWSDFSGAILYLSKGTDLPDGVSVTVPKLGVLKGAGTIPGDVINEGTIEPGNSIGELNITGSYTQTSEGALKIELAGMSSGEYDYLSISGQAVLAGSIVVSFLEEFQATAGDEFEFLYAAGGISGAFDPVQSPGSLNWLITYEASNSSLIDTARLTVVPVSDAEPPAPDPELPVIDDGVAYCAIGCGEGVSDTGARTVVFDFEDPETGTQVRLEAVLPAAHGDPLRHRVDRTLLDGTETLTEAVSDVPGSTVTLERDADGRPRIVTRAVLDDGVILEVLARADGSAEHRVSAQAGETVAATDVPGALTRFMADGQVKTLLEFASGQVWFRALVWTEPDGRGRTGFERWEDLAGEWVLESRTIDDTVSRFEAGHRVWIEPDEGDGLRFQVETQVTRDLYF